MIACRVFISVYAYTYADYADAGNAAILHLNVGDKVYLKAHDDYDQTLFGQGDQIYTTFTGELLYADNVGTYHFGAPPPFILNWYFLNEDETNNSLLHQHKTVIYTYILFININLRRPTLVFIAHVFLQSNKILCIHTFYETV